MIYSSLAVIEILEELEANATAALSDGDHRECARTLSKIRAELTDMIETLREEEAEFND